MKKIILVIICLFSAGFSMSQALSTLDSVLCDIYAKDQGVREELIRCYGINNADSLILAVTNMNRVDSINQVYVFALLDKGGWVEGLSEDANSAIFLVVDHADLKFQQKYYPILKQGSERGLIGKDKCAILLDRILMKEGKKQIYGTQTVMISENDRSTTYLWPVEDIENIDVIRKEVDLGPLSKYVETMQKSGFKLVIDHKFTVKELKKRITFD